MGIEDYIRRAAAARGIDPDIAVRVARSEGGLKDPTRQSLVTKNGVQEPSYGPFQLLIGGGNTGFPRGMGNDALAAGIDPRDPNQWQKGVDFALDNAARSGWGAWYGAKAAGIGNRQGIGGKPAQVLGTSFAQNPTSSPVAPPAGTEIAPPITKSRTIQDAPIFNNSDHMRYDAMASQAPIDHTEGAAPVDSTFFGRIADKMKQIGDKPGVANAMKLAQGATQNTSSQAEAHQTPMPSNIAAVEATDAARIANATQLMNALLQKRKGGGFPIGTSFVG